MTPAAFQALKHGDTIQDMTTGQAYKVANPFDEATSSIDVFKIEPVELSQAKHFQKVEWPN